MPSSPRLASRPIAAAAHSPRSASGSSDAEDTTNVPPELRCSYRSKPCQKRRAMKVNGELHKLCPFHRQRANVNQQRVHLRRRISKKQAQQLEALYGPLSGDDSASEFEPCPEPCGDLTLQELQLLELLLSDKPVACDVFSEALHRQPSQQQYYQQHSIQF